MKYKILTAALLVILPVFLTGCSVQDIPVIGKLLNKGNSSNNSSKEVTINMWGLWESPEVMDKMIAEYKKTHPNVTIKYQDHSVIKPDQYKETITDRLKEGQVFDIILVHNSWVKTLADNLSEVPSTVYTTDSFSKTFYPVENTSAVVNNKLYAVPAFYDGLALVYNKKHFESINQTYAPTAWEEFRNLAQSLTIRGKDGSLIRAGAAIGTSNNIEFASDILGLMFAQANIALPNNLDSRDAQDVLTFYTNFVREDHVWDSSMPEAATAFAREQVSMIFVPSWNLLDIVRVRPDLDIGVAPVPQAIPDKPVGWASFWMYAVPKNSPNQAAAWDFIKFLMSDEQQLNLFGEASKYRKFGAPFASMSLKDQVAGSADLTRYLKAYLDSAQNSTSNVLAARAGNNSVVDPIRQAVTSVIDPNTHLSSEQALKVAKDLILNPASAKK